MINKLQKEKIRAVHDEDLKNFLDGLGILKKFKEGDFKCKFCDTKITFKNLHSLFPQAGSIKFVCDGGNCIRELHDLLRSGEVSV